MTARGLEEPRIIPLQAHVDPEGYNDVLGKVRGKNLIRLIFTVPTVRLKHKNREWTETEQIYLLLPFPTAAKIAEKLYGSLWNAVKSRRGDQKEFDVTAESYDLNQLIAIQRNPFFSRN